jgi:hypothetical protein
MSCPCRQDPLLWRTAAQLAEGRGIAEGNLSIPWIHLLRKSLPTAAGHGEYLVPTESSQFTSGLEQRFDLFMTEIDIYTQYNGDGPGA